MQPNSRTPSDLAIDRSDLASPGRQVRVLHGVGLVPVSVVVGSEMLALHAAPPSFATGGASASTAEPVRLGEITVERLNVVESHATLRLVVSSRDRFPEDLIPGGGDSSTGPLDGATSLRALRRWREDPMRSAVQVQMRMLLLAVAGAAGCATVAFGDVQLAPSFAGATGTRTVEATLSDEEPSEAIRIVDEVARQGGLVRGREGEMGDMVRMHGSSGDGDVLHCYARLKSGCLVVTFADVSPGGFGPRAITMLDEITVRFVEQFGPARVERDPPRIDQPAEDAGERPRHGDHARSHVKHPSPPVPGPATSEEGKETAQLPPPTP